MLSKIFAATCLALLVMISMQLLLLLFPIMGSALIVLAIIPLTRHWARKKCYHLWIAFDKFANAMRFHDHRETISSCLGKAIYHGHPPVFNWLIIDKAVSWLLNKVDPDHCKKSIDWTVGRKQGWRMSPYAIL